MKHKTALLLVNLGTPEDCDPSSVRRYLKEFLSDRRVIELSPWLWKPILYTLILPLRPFRAVKAYQAIWMKNIDESPLRYFTRMQASRLSKVLDTAHTVEWAMRYGTPSIESRIKALNNKGYDRILILPLYPQYSASTTASAVDEVARILKGIRAQPNIRIIEPYYQHPAYIDALVISMKAHLKALKWLPDKILVTFHGMPKSSIEKGDPYYSHCKKSFNLLKKAMGKGFLPLEMSFQSRFGPKAWLEPSTDQTLKRLAEEGATNIAVIAPGFASDCLETLEELQVKNQEMFKAVGGKNFTQIPCMNDSNTAIDLYKKIIIEAASDWL